MKSISAFFGQKNTKKPLTIGQVYDSLLKIANTSGSDSTNLKTAIIIKLIQNATAVEAKFIVRYLTKNLKIGANEKTVLSALA